MTIELLRGKRICSLCKTSRSPSCFWCEKGFSLSLLTSAGHPSRRRRLMVVRFAHQRRPRPSLFHHALTLLNDGSMNTPPSTGDGIGGIAMRNLLLFLLSISLAWECSFFSLPMFQVPMRRRTSCRCGKQEVPSPSLLTMGLPHLLRRSSACSNKMVCTLPSSALVSRFRRVPASCERPLRQGMSSVTTPESSESDPACSKPDQMATEQDLRRNSAGDWCLTNAVQTSLRCHQCDGTRDSGATWAVSCPLECRLA